MTYVASYESGDRCFYRVFEASDDAVAHLPPLEWTLPAGSLRRIARQACGTPVWMANDPRCPQFQKTNRRSTAQAGVTSGH